MNNLILQISDLLGDLVAKTSVGKHTSGSKGMYLSKVESLVFVLIKVPGSLLNNLCLEMWQY